MTMTCYNLLCNHKGHQTTKVHLIYSASPDPGGHVYLLDATKEFVHFRTTVYILVDKVSGRDLPTQVPGDEKNH